MKKQFVLFNKVVSELGQSKKRISKQSLASGKVSFVALRIVLQAEKQLRQTLK